MAGHVQGTRHLRDSHVVHHVLATYRAGGKGVVFSPNYAGMNLATLDGAAEALKELGLK